MIRLFKKSTHCAKFILFESICAGGTANFRRALARDIRIYVAKRQTFAAAIAQPALFRFSPADDAMPASRLHIFVFLHIYAPPFCFSVRISYRPTLRYRKYFYIHRNGHCG